MMRTKPAVIQAKLLVTVTLATILFVARPTIQRTACVRNDLRDRILIVHCRSADDNLHAHLLDVKANISWSFNDNSELVRLTFFRCRLAVEDKRLSFNAYYQGTDIGGYDIEWSVRDDGVYLVTGDGNVESSPRQEWN
ncbi:unnamed protein product [Linum tenue]|uniref:S-protein homolog n=1 Tax=Linum tenue TaxID=586396 RepID=A0AAV0IGF3_9ROSI|nr:unnamed protein product [Linum tenue]